MTSYLIIGDGQVARHFSFYFKQLEIPFKTWSRGSEIELEPLVQMSKRILLLISDDSIHRFVNDHPFLQSSYLVHFSGTRSFTFAQMAHPLNAFGSQLYEFDIYRGTPFIIDQEGDDFNQILPGLPNESFKLNANKKSLYHALCVMSGNFTTILWQNVMDKFSRELGLPANVLHPYMERIFQNVKATPDAALTGPIKRGDTETIIKNLEAFSGTPEQTLYYAFLNYYLAKNKKIGDHKNERLRL